MSPLDRDWHQREARSFESRSLSLFTCSDFAVTNVLNSENDKKLALEEIMNRVIDLMTIEEAARNLDVST